MRCRINGIFTMLCLQIDKSKDRFMNWWILVAGSLATQFFFKSNLKWCFIFELNIGCINLSAFSFWDLVLGVFGNTEKRKNVSGRFFFSFFRLDYYYCSYCYMRSTFNVKYYSFVKSIFHYYFWLLTRVQ